MINEAIAYWDTQVKEKTYLGPDGTFVTDEEYPKFVRQELIVNAVTHRAYSITGTDIQIKMFDDHFTVESPGTLPGIVRINNMRQVHYSRNPKIAEFLHEYEYVREYGEGVDRLYMEMKQAGLPAPKYKMEAFMLHATISNKRIEENDDVPQDTPQVNLQVNPQVNPQVAGNDLAGRIIEFCRKPKRKTEIAKYCGYTDERYFTKKYLKPLLQEGIIEMTIPDKPNSCNQRYITTSSK